MMRNLILIVLLLAATSWAGEPAAVSRHMFNAEKQKLLNDVRLQTQEEARAQEKSPLKAALFSAVIPGAGEFYAESYWKAALFAVVEVAAIAGYFSYDARGDDKDAQMRDFGDEHWSEQRYWSKVYMLALENDDWQYDQLQTQGSGVISDADYTSTNINRLRDLESSAGYPGFTHTLPNTKTQQYYEMIYKYLSQFGSGWDDVPSWTYYDAGANSGNLTPNIQHYRSLRNKSNDLYQMATNMATVIMLNHLVSAFDAAFTARSYNKRVQASFYGGQKIYAGEAVNTLGVSVAW